MGKIVYPPSEVMDIIRKEYARAKKGGKRIPIHSSSQAGRVIEQANVLMDVALRSKYGPIKDRLKGSESIEAMRQAAAATAVACIRLLEKLNQPSISSFKNKTNVIHQDQGGQAHQEG